MLERVSQVREMLNSSCHPFQTNLWAVPKKEWGQTLLVQSDVRTAGFRIIQISVIQHGRLPGKDAKTWDTSVINFYMEHQVQGVYSVFVHFSKPGHCPPLPVLPVSKFSFTKIPPYKFSTHSKIKYHFGLSFDNPLFSIDFEWVKHFILHAWYIWKDLIRGY